LISGSMGTQPFYKKLYGELVLKNSSLIDRMGMYVPNHPSMTHDEIQLICDKIIEASRISN